MSEKKQMVNNVGLTGFGWNGIGWTETVFEKFLNDQIEFVNRRLEDLPPRTEKEQEALAWDDKAVMQF